MDEDHDHMYVGSKDHILSLDLHDVNRNPRIVRPFIKNFFSLKWGFTLEVMKALIDIIRDQFSSSTSLLGS